MYKTDVLMIIKTSGLEYDDRLRKEALTIKNLKLNTSILVLGYNNQKNKGVANYGVRFESIRLISRKLFPRKSALAIKLFEMYVKFLLGILKKRPRVVWAHNCELAGLIWFLWIFKKIGIIERVVWDQHELMPPRFLKDKFFKIWFKLLIECCDAIVTANKDRKEYTLSSLSIEDNSKYVVVENYCDNKSIDSPPGKLPPYLSRWLEGKEYFVVLGGASQERYFKNAFESVLRLKEYKLITVGPDPCGMEERLVKMYGDKVSDICYMTGFVSQNEIVNYLDNALASIILYSSDSINSFYCAPNRLYQSIARGIPVIVGNNPPMKEAVERLNCGVVLAGDGREMAHLDNGLHKLLNNLAEYKQKAALCKREFVWESQSDRIASAINLFPHPVTP